ncbi:MAG: NUDIX hydrolase [Pirellulales bacterium]|jgi:mutator protein MutT
MNDALIDYLATISWCDNDVAECHAKLQPPFCYGRQRGPCPSGTRQAGVLILLSEEDGNLSVTLTKRAADLQHHASQISFPGGGVEPGESWQMAAVRETHEEIGISANCISIITALEPVFVYRSNNLMFPFVATLTDDSEVIADEVEVDSAFDVQLSQLQAGFGSYSNLAYSWKPLEVPGYQVPEGVIWGATAMVLSQLLSILDDFTG